MADGIDISFVFEKITVEREKIKRRAESAEKREMNKTGAYIRQVIVNLLRKKGKPHATAPAGSPPLSHTGGLRRLVRFAWDDRTKSEVIGPTQVKGTAVQALETGGETQIVNWKGKKQTVEIKPHPFLGPSLQASLPKIPDYWRNAIRGT